MKILVADIPEEGLDLELEETFEPGPFRLLSPVNASLHVDKVSSEILVRGTLKTLVELQCSRCLKQFPLEVDLTVDVVYHPLEDLRGEERHEIKDDELDMGFYRGDEIDVQELLREQVILSIPIKPLCTESCKGICPQCGADLNTDTCTCDRKGSDPRLAGLKKLMDTGKE